MIDKNNITAVILSGGRSSRMQGEDKGLILLDGKPLISYVVNVAKGKVSQLLISANRNIEKYQTYGKVVSDDMSDFQGPLAGIAKSMLVIDTQFLLILPCDSPLVTKIVVDRLTQCMANKEVDICVADDGTSMQPTFALIRASLKDNLLAFLDSGERKLGLWIEQNNFLKVDFSDQPEIFINLNSPEDFDKL